MNLLTEILTINHIIMRIQIIIVIEEKNKDTVKDEYFKRLDKYKVQVSNTNSN